MRIQTLLFICATLLAFSARAQQPSPDTLSRVRKLFQTDIYMHNVKLSKARFSQNLVKSIKWSNKNRMANAMQIAGPLVSAAGLGLAVDALVGTKMQANVDGKTYPYVKRSLPELVGGIALVVTGFCLGQSANDIKMNASEWFNEQAIKDYEKKQTSFNLKLGIGSSGGIGLVAKFK